LKVNKPPQWPNG